MKLIMIAEHDDDANVIKQLWEMSNKTSKNDEDHYATIQGNVSARFVNDSGKAWYDEIQTNRPTIVVPMEKGKYNLYDFEKHDLIRGLNLSMALKYVL